MKKFGICFDTETTGLLLPRKADLDLQPFITEIYLCKFDLESFEVLEEFESLINIPITIPEHITKITKIDNAMLEGKPTFEKVAEEIENFFDKHDCVVGQNLMFDLEVLKYNFLKYKMKNHIPEFKNKICTVEKSFPMFNKRVPLGKLYEAATGMEIKNAHRAKDDVLATLTVYKWLLSEGF
jgi:DNA polymerase-3 subunit epsilon